MATNVRVDIDDSQKILLKRYLNKNGKAQVEFTKLVAKYSNNYVPYDTGRLKDMMVSIETDRIVFNAPYSKVQYYTNKGEGKQGTSMGGRRGKMWDKRMFIDHGDKIVQSIAEFVGGKAK